MPVVDREALHREKLIACLPAIHSACVSKLLTPEEIKHDTRALDAIFAEAAKLQEKGTWDMSSVRSKRDVAKDARANNAEVHFGRIFPICNIKHSELPDGDPLRVPKGRLVFGGDNVRDAHGDWAIFATSAPNPQQSKLAALRMPSAYSPASSLRSQTQNRPTSRQS